MLRTDSGGDGRKRRWPLAWPDETPARRTALWPRPRQPPALGQVELDEPQDDMLDFGEFRGLILGLGRREFDRLGPDVGRERFFTDRLAVKSLGDPVGSS